MHSGFSSSISRHCNEIGPKFHFVSFPQALLLSLLTSSKLLCCAHCVLPGKRWGHSTGQLYAAAWIGLAALKLTVTFYCVSDHCMSIKSELVFDEIHAMLSHLSWSWTKNLNIMLIVYSLIVAYAFFTSLFNLISMQCGKSNTNPLACTVKCQKWLCSQPEPSQESLSVTRGLSKLLLRQKCLPILRYSWWSIHLMPHWADSLWHCRGYGIWEGNK